MNGTSCAGKQLRTWGQIAAYLDTSTDIVMRWARKYGLPVKKYPGVNGSIVADTEKLDKWADSNIRPAR